MNILSQFKQSSKKAKKLSRTEKIKETEVRKKLFVVTTNILVNNNKHEIKAVKWHYLAILVDNVYYEYFAGKRLEKTEKDCQVMDKPIILNVEPLENYIRKPLSIHEMDNQALFDYINKLNILESIGAFLDD